MIDKRKPGRTLGCSKHDVIVAQYWETAGSLQLHGFHALATSSDGFTNAPLKSFGQHRGFTTTSSMLASFISHVKKVNAASCLRLPIWPLIAPSTMDWPPGAWFTTTPSWYSVAWRQKDLLQCTVSWPSLHQTFCEPGMMAMPVVASSTGHCKAVQWRDDPSVTAQRPARYICTSSSAHRPRVISGRPATCFQSLCTTGFSKRVEKAALRRAAVLKSLCGPSEKDVFGRRTSI